MRLLTLLCLALLVAPTPAHSTDGEILIQMSSGAKSACLEPFGTLELRVFALLRGQTTSGIRGAEYRIATSVATDWIYGEDFSPSTARGVFQVGVGAVDPDGGNWLNPLTRGVNLGFETCQFEPVGYFLLQTILVLDITGQFAGTPVTLTVEGHDTPGNPFYRCPLFNLCDDPVFTKVCLGTDEHLEVCPFPPGALACRVSTSRQFFINHDPNDPGTCTVAVEERTWSQMKSLYH